MGQKEDARVRSDHGDDRYRSQEIKAKNPPGPHSRLRRHESGLSFRYSSPRKPFYLGSNSQAEPSNGSSEHTDPNRRVVRRHDRLLHLSHLSRKLFQQRRQVTSVDMVAVGPEVGSVTHAVAPNGGPA